MNILETTALTVRYGSGATVLTAVEKVSLAVPEHGTLGLVGESGCGKSTVARAIVGLVPVAGGTITFGGEDCTSERVRNSKRYRRRVQMVFQDPYSSLNPRMSVLELLSEAIGTRGSATMRSSSAKRTEATRILGLVDLPSHSLERYPHQFSGGQRQRIAVARALAVLPDLIILDEVTSSLDVSVQASILNLLRDIQRELGVAYLLISHDLSVVRAMSDVVSVMYLARVAEAAPTNDLFVRPQHPYTAALMASVPTLVGKRQRAPLSGDVPNPRHPPAGCRFNSRCPVGPLFIPSRTICFESDPTVGAAARLHSAACHFAPSVPD